MHFGFIAAVGMRRANRYNEVLEELSGIPSR